MALRTFIRFIGKQASRGDCFLHIEAFRKWRTSGDNPVPWFRGPCTSFAVVRVNEILNNRNNSRNWQNHNQVSCHHDSFMLLPHLGRSAPIVDELLLPDEAGEFLPDTPDLSYFFFVTKSGAKENIDAMLSSTLI
jgi:hypothetical protein